jgi:tryptophan-rich sensory protein
MASSGITGSRGSSPAIAVLATVLVTLALNGVVFALGWAGAPHPNPLLPPGWVIGSVWVLLLALLAVAWWLLANADLPGTRRLSPWVLALIGGCLAYPFYTLGFSNDTNALIGNLATIAGGAFLAGRVMPVARSAAGLILLTVIWVSFATFATFGR